MAEYNTRLQLERVGIKDPLEHWNAVEEHRQAEEADYAARQQAQTDDFYRQFDR